MKKFMSKKIRNMTVGDSIKYSGLMSGIGILFAVLTYGGVYMTMKIKGEI